MRHTALLLASAAGLALAAPAMAADYDPPLVDYDPPVYEQAPEYVPVEIGSGWYLRGDIGYSLKTKAHGDFTYRTYDPVAGTYGADRFDTARLADDFSFAVGFGYAFTDWLRADVTAERFGTSFTGTTTSPAPCLPDPAYAGTTCRSEDGADMTAYAAMLNAYVDLGTYVGITPYVGAGAGVSYVDWDTLNSGIYCAGAGCPAAYVADASHPGEASWRFTYALMAGLAYDVTDNLKVDLGYKYRRVADGAMFGFDAATAAAGASGTQGRDPGFSQHEVRVGLRYELW
ncbi:porin family protein [Aquibium sp. A9E412]|uniref:outer membrane protein n=1 Tax=Aquibium sp. A9E412 TaxID=2976767 RepID=UPI0025AFC759|nr:outer membrane protein [Aquibium sp. A9E412]MDN2565357.1 porin family protein [Aquibium sp. A9E412]